MKIVRTTLGLVVALASTSWGQCSLQVRSQIGGTNTGVDMDPASRLAAVSALGSGLELLDLTDPAAPSLLSVTPFPYDAQDVTLAGNLACVSAGQDGIAFFDISDPENPQWLSIFAGLDDAKQAAAVGDVVYVASRSTGLEILDIANPAAPKRLKRFTTDYLSYGVDVQNGIAYVAEGVGGLRVVDVSDPSHPFELARVDTDADAAEVAVSGNIACVADNDLGLRVFDVSNPAAPVLVGSAPCQGSGMSEIRFDGDFVFISAVNSLGGIYPYDVSDPAHPVALPRQVSDFVSGIAVGAPGELLMTRLSLGLSDLDSTDPSALQTVSEFSTPDYGQSAATIGSTAFIGSNNNLGLMALDLSDPYQPLPLGAALRGEEIWELAAEGQTLCAAAGSSFLTIDATDPASLQLLGSIAGSGLNSVALSGATAFVVQSNSGLWSVDVSDPTNPTQLQFLALPGQATNVAVTGDLALVSCSFGGLQIIDISDPSHMSLVGTYQTSSGYVSEVAASGDLAFARARTGQDGSVDIVDISDPAHPQALSSVNPGASKYGTITARGDWLFLARSVDDFVIAYDVSDPAKPVATNTIGLRDTPSGIWATPLGLLTMDSTRGLLVSAIECCTADFNSDGAVDTQDVLAFLNAWVIGDGSADIDGNGTVNTQDVLRFLNAWTAGC
ncbi:MAG: hypothetical protein IPJ41_00350 [Phycisphaerales bacterium]|nr:hypothetical protein [Phycisphaerales bacterium]